MTIYPKSQAYREIVKLVADFHANELGLSGVSEAQIEQNYLRKLFHYLNWNVDNTGLPVSQWEFILQKTTPTGKRPDYIVQLDGQQLLVMDAKKVKYGLHDPRWMQQVYAYAYSTQNQPTPRKIDFAILTNFKEFILFDCALYAAHSQAVSNFRILDWTCDDYVSQFDTLWELFERENVRAALRLRDTHAPSGLWARYLSPKKVKANRLPPDEAFLSEMDDEKTGWRVRLAKDMKKRNPAADGALITAAVQLLIDRLIFVKALSDREIEDDYLTQLAERVEQSGLAADDAGWFNTCQDIFAKLNQFYNGSVFEPRPELEAVTVSNKVVREVIRDLQPENSPYNFAVLPIEILGTIYERFLGRVVRTTDSRVKIEDKPEVRKAGGVYYTPQYIVDYIVQNTVSALLATCQTPADVAKLRILDPACGSGSFLLGAYAALIRWHEAYYGDKKQLTRHDREAAYDDSDGRVRLTAKLKRAILLNNLFGVDIDAQAVEVTRFSLSLKALEDTRRDELYEEVNLFKQTVLPDLSHNIKCGNSLIGDDYSMLPTERAAVNAFEWQNEFPSVMADDGFNAVISNPPYVRILHLARDKDYYKRAYVSATGAYDIYVLFMEKALSLVRPKGLIGLITPNKYFIADYAKGIRQVLLSNTSLLEIADMGHCKSVFSGALISTAITIFEKASPTNTLRLKILTDDNAHHIDQAPIQSVPRNQIVTSNGTIQVYANNETNAIFDRLEQHSQPLSKVAQVRTGVMGFDYWAMDKWIDDKNKGRLIATNSYIGRYEFLWGKKVRLYKREVYRPRLDPKCDVLNENTLKLFGAKKIVVRGVARRLTATLDEEGIGLLVAVHSVVSEQFNQRFLLGLLNSNLFNWLHIIQFYSARIPEGSLRYPISFLANLPIYRVNFGNPADKARHDRIVELVTALLDLHKLESKAKTQNEQQNYHRQINTTDREINALVYELYGLKKNEIEIIESQA